MGRYSNKEYADIHFMFGKANGDAFEAARLYQEAFPHRKHPSVSLFVRIRQCLVEYGCFTEVQVKPTGITFDGENNEQLEVKEEAEYDPGISTTRKRAVQNGVSNGNNRCQHHELLYPYHLYHVQGLVESDFLIRKNFCQWMQQQCNLNPRFLGNIFFTDEVQFTSDNILTFRDFFSRHRLSSNETLCTINESQDQHISKTVIVWAGLIGDCIVGPHFLSEGMKGKDYFEFLQNVLSNLLDNVPLQQRQNMWFMHDGFPAHIADMIQHLNDKYGQRWIGVGGPVMWPHRSSDLNPMDFCIWGYIKNLVYASDIKTMEELQHRIKRAFQTINNDIGLPERIRNSMQRRFENCVRMQGQHFEHLL